MVEHDFIMATYLADRVIVFEGTPSVNTRACAPQSLLTGMNKFLEQLQITFRRDPSNYRYILIQSDLGICFNFHPNFICRPRINKLNSVKDSEQKASGNYFFLEDE